MADTTLSAHIVTDTHTLASATQAIIARVLPQPGPRGSLAVLLAKQLRLVFIDTAQSLFVFGSPDVGVLAQANLYARQPLENALKNVFEEKVRLELVLFDGSQDSLSSLIARFASPAEPQDDPSTSQAPSTLHAEPDREDSPVPAEGRQRGARTVQVKLVQDSLRSVFTSPKRVVVVPGYLLRWIPYIGPLRTSIVVACFQAFYHSRGSTAKANLTFEAPGPFLAAVAGIAESSIWRHLDDPELGWFLKRVPYGPGENRWIRD